VSCAPLSVPPSSWTWKLKASAAVPFAFAAGVKTRLPAVMSAAAMASPAVTAAPFRVSVPFAGVLAMMTLRRLLLAGASALSSKPKFATVSV